jgi:hypothetical protein
MGLFKSKPEKVLDDIERAYAAGMASIQAQVTGTSRDLRLEMAKYHGAVLENACLRALRDRGMSPEPETLSRDYWAVTCLRYGLGAPGAAPNPWNSTPTPKPASPLTKKQRKATTAAYEEAFDKWMVQRIERGHDSPEDFARGDFFAWTTAYEEIADHETAVSGDDLSALRIELYAANVERLGYTNSLPRPLPMMGA